MSRRRVLIAVTAAGVLGAIGWYMWRQHVAADPYAAFSLWGNVDVHQVEVAFRVGGRISELKVEEGDRVEAGAVLGQLDRVPFENDVAAAEANVALAQAQLTKATRGFRVEEIAQARASVRQREADLTNARSTLARIEGLFPQGAVTRQQLDDAQARVRDSEAQLTSAREQLTMVTRGSRIEDIEAQQATLAAAQARLAQAKTALQDATLIAPSRGLVAVKARETGSIVQPGQTVYTVVLDDPVWIRAYVAQPRLGRIKPGVPVEIEIDSTPGKRYHGTVGFISPEAEFTPKNVQTEQVRDDLVYRLRVIARDPDNVFRQGMPVTVHVPQAQSQVATAGRP
jgi:HlyD family secretion protein